MAAAVKRHRKLKPGDVIFRLVNGLIMLTTIVVMIYPFWNTIAISFNDAQWCARSFPRCSASPSAR